MPADGVACNLRRVRFEPRALIFDMDGLMVDSEPLWFQVEQAFVVDRGGSWTHEDGARCVGRGLPATVEAMIAKLGSSLTVEAGVVELTDRFVARAGEVKLKPGCLELLEVARGRAGLAVASSSPRRLVARVLEETGLAPRFGVVVTGDDVVRTKPEPDIFLLTAERLGAAPADCLVLEDSLAGVTAAHRARMPVIAVPEGPGPHDAFASVASFVARDLFEAMERIQLPAP